MHDISQSVYCRCMHKLQEAEQVREKDKKRWQDFVNKVSFDTLCMYIPVLVSLQCFVLCSVYSTCCDFTIVQ